MARRKEDGKKIVDYDFTEEYADAEKDMADRRYYDFEEFY